LFPLFPQAQVDWGGTGPLGEEVSGRPPLLRKGKLKALRGGRSSRTREKKEFYCRKFFGQLGGPGGPGGGGTRSCGLRSPGGGELVPSGEQFFGRPRGLVSEMMLYTVFSFIFRGGRTGRFIAGAGNGGAISQPFSSGGGPPNQTQGGHFRYSGRRSAGKGEPFTKRKARNRGQVLHGGKNRGKPEGGLVKFFGVVHMG